MVSLPLPANGTDLPRTGGRDGRERAGGREGSNGLPDAVPPQNLEAEEAVIAVRSVGRPWPWSIRAVR